MKRYFNNISKFIKRRLVDIAMILFLLTFNLILNTGNFTFYHGTLFMVYSMLLYLAFITKNHKSKSILSVSATIFLVFTFYFFPLHFEFFEEVFFLLPLIYIFIHPGKFQINLVSCTIGFIYYMNRGMSTLENVIEDFLEVLLITFLASLTSYYYMKVKNQMLRYKYFSYTDDLTSLPNRKAFIRDIEDTIKNNGDDTTFAILLLDLDGFKYINDTFGHLTGDAILSAIANRLRTVILDYETYRISGDEFSYIVKEERSGTRLWKNLSKLIFECFKDPFIHDNRQYYITTSIGVSLYPADGKDLSTLLKNADIALYRSKDAGKNSCTEYNSLLMKKSVKRHLLEHDLRNSITNNELSVVYQPKVNVENNEIVGAEALIRWYHPKYKFVSPADFIPIAEEINFIHEIGTWVLRESTRQIASWNIQKCKEFKLAVNLSAVQLHTKDIDVIVKDILAESNLDSKYLELELTESVLMKNPPESIQLLKKIKDLGVSIAMDDFGIAYSSLSYLKELPLDTLKIDKYFLQDIDKDKNDKMITKAIIQLGHNLDLLVLAEGIENRKQLNFLKSEKCDYYQGYFFSKPVPPEEFIKLLKK